MWKTLEGSWLHKQFALNGYANGVGGLSSWDDWVWAELQGYLAVRVHILRANRLVALESGLRAADRSMRYLRGIQGGLCPAGKYSCLLGGVAVFSHRQEGLAWVTLEWIVL